MTQNNQKQKEQEEEKLVEAATYVFDIYDDGYARRWRNWDQREKINAEKEEALKRKAKQQLVINIINSKLMEEGFIENQKVTDEEVQKYFEKNKQKYAVPELRKVSYLHFSKKDFAKDLQISEAELLAEYEKNKDAFIKPENRKG